MLIVLEGLDGAGKSTQVKMLDNYLSSLGKKVKYLHFPRFDSPVYGDLIARFLRGDFGSNSTVHPQLVALLFAEDRHNAAPLLRSWLKEGNCIVLDRYVYSNIAFQCSKLADGKEAETLRKWILETEYTTFNIPRPDLNLFLDVPIGFVDEKLKNSRNGDDRAYLNGKSDIHEADIHFQIKVRNIYRQECERDRDFIRIECSDKADKMLSSEIIFEKIKEKVEQSL